MACKWETTKPIPMHLFFLLEQGDTVGELQILLYILLANFG